MPSPSLVGESRLAAAAAAAAFRVDPTLIFVANRCRRPVARARQAAIYLLHIGFGHTYARTGSGFARDRTTVRHACAVIEDARDDPSFDKALSLLEIALRSQAEFCRAMSTDDEARG